MEIRIVLDQIDPPAVARASLTRALVEVLADGGGVPRWLDFAGALVHRGPSVEHDRIDQNPPGPRSCRGGLLDRDMFETVR